VSLQTVIMTYDWLAGVQFLEFMVFNVKSEFLSLFLHEFKTAESWDSLRVANLQLQKEPWVAIFGKTPPNPLDKKATREHEQEMVEVVECLQGVHGFMYICVCVYVCGNEYMYVYACVYVYVYVHVYTHVDVYVYVYLCIDCGSVYQCFSVWTVSCMRMCIRVHMYAYAYVCKYIYMCIFLQWGLHAL